MRSITTTMIAFSAAATLSFVSVPASAQNTNPKPCQAQAFSKLQQSINRGKTDKVNGSTIAAATYMYASAKRLRAAKRLVMCQNALQSGNYLMTMAIRIKRAASAPKPAAKRPGTFLTAPTQIANGKVLAKAGQIKHGQAFGYSFWMFLDKAFESGE